MSLPMLWSQAPAMKVSMSAARQHSFSAGWVATDGKLGANENFTAFSADAYKSMAGDQSRTPPYEQAIKERLAGTTGKVVLDIGTGPFALLALIAARAGAAVVYAVEANAQAAALAREAVAAATDVPEGVVQVVEGFSTDVTLPQKVDLVVSEIVGSVASEEGIYATMQDAQARHVARPCDPASYIPCRVVTLAAPFSYALHHSALGPAGFDWAEVRAEKAPPRFSCSYQALQPLAAPELAEDIRVAEELSPGSTDSKLSFQITEEFLQSAADAYVDMLTKGGLGLEDARGLACELATSLSGVGFWPRLYLDPEEKIVVEARGSKGEHSRSHWQTVMPLLSDRAMRVGPGDVVDMELRVQLGEALDMPPQYSFEGKLIGS